MMVKIFKSLVGILVLSTLVSACGGGGGTRNRKLNPVGQKPGAGGITQKAAVGLDNWVESEKKKTDSEFKSSSPEVSTVTMSRSALKAYQKTTKGKASDKVEEKNKVLQLLLAHVEISAQKKDNKTLAVIVKVFDAKSETTRKPLINFTGDITAATGGGPLKAEILDDELNKLLIAKQITAPTKGSKTQIKPGAAATAVKVDRFTADAKCFDKDCYNMIVRIFDNREGGFLAYFYRLIDVSDQTADIKVKISSLTLADIEKNLTKENRRDILSQKKIETDGCHYQLELSSSNFSFKSAYSLALVEGVFNLKMQITESDTSRIRGESYGTIADSELDEYLVCLKKK